MIHTGRWVLSTFLFIGSPQGALSQDSIAVTIPERTLAIVTDIEGAPVFVNGELIGETPLSTGFPPGRHALLLMHPEMDNWLARSIRDSVDVHTGSPDTLFYRFGRYISVSSDPFGATVSVQDSVVGTTPVVFKLESSIAGSIIHLQKPEYEPATLDLRHEHGRRLAVTLTQTGSGTGLPDVFPDHSHSSNASPLPLYIAGAAAVVSGGLAAHFKLKADDNYAAYRFTGDPAALQRTNRFDTAAALSIAATQISIGLLTYFILSD